MKKIIAVTAVVTCTSTLCVNAQNLLNNPESVVFDPPRNRYLVSNWGDGTIVQIDSSGAQSYFSTVLLNQFRLVGLYIKGDTLLAAAGDAPNAGLVGFDLETAGIVLYIVLPGVGLPNDITTDRAGIIYVTDYWGDKLYKIDNGVPSVYLEHGLDYPNGIVYDDRFNRLLIASVMGPGSPILAVNLDDSSISTVVTTGLYGTDGITLDADYRVYISEGTDGNVYRYDSAFSRPLELFSSGHDDPADIYYDRVNVLLAVPNLSSNSVDFIPVDVPSGGGTGRIAYCQQPSSGTAGYEIHSINLDGSEDEKISDALFGVNHHDWSPNGDKLAAVGYVDHPNTWSIYVFDAGGGNLERLTTTSDVWDNEPSWSPDGTRIAFARIYPADSFREEIWMMNPDGSDQHWIGVYGDNPTWSPDGTRLVYHSSRNGDYDIYTCGADGTMEQQLTNTAAYLEIGPDWSPDGSKIVYSTDRYGSREIYTMNPDGTSPTRLTNNSVDDFMPAWSPDGSLIAFSSGLPGNDRWEVYVMNADGTNVRRVTHTLSTTTAINPDWQPVDSSIVPVYLAYFSCSRVEEAIKVAWTVRDDANAANFRLVAEKNGRQRDVPVSATGPRNFESIDRDPSLKSGGTVLYSLYGRQDNGRWSLLRTGRVGLQTPRLGSRLSGVYPNPFNPRTTIAFTLDLPRDVTVAVHDASGRLIRTLARRNYPAGDHELTWDGRDAKGREVSSGVYFVKFDAGKASDSRKLILVK